MKLKNWTKEPITYGGLMKLYAICMGISLIYSAIYAAAMFWPNWWEDTKDWFRRHFTPKRTESGET